MEVLLCLSIALAVGLLMTRFMKPLGLPAVTGYLLAGILVGPYCLGSFGSFLAERGVAYAGGIGYLSKDVLSGFEIISDVALGFIAFSLGSEFRLSQLKKTGKQATVVGIIQAVSATVLVDSALLLLHLAIPEKLPLSAALILGAVASATAPATTLMVVRQYKAKGPLTDILLPIVALDDAVGLILFAVSFGVARALESGGVDLISVIVNPLLEIVFSLLLGMLMGVLLSYFERFFKSNSKRLCLSVTFVLMTVALSQIEIPLFGGAQLSFSSLLVCMMLGTVFCNVCDFSGEMMERTEKWTMPLYILFFTISGASLEFSVFSDWIIVLIGLVYIFFRTAGKYLGARFSASAVKCDKSIVNFLGVTLLPQEGVALGMAAAVCASVDFPGEVGVLVRNIVLFSVLIYELVGPFATKQALVHAGDIDLGNSRDARVHNDIHISSRGTRHANNTKPSAKR